jgi:site-specific recombinase XerC
MLAYAKAFFSWGVGRGYIEVNPAAGISKPTREVARERTPDLQDLIQICRVMEHRMEHRDTGLTCWILEKTTTPTP